MFEINHSPSKRELRLFAGLWFPLFCAGLGSGLAARAHVLGAGVVVWGLGLVVMVVGLASPARLRPMFIGMSVATYPFGWVLGRALLAALYFGVCMPLGLCMRALGRDALKRRFDTEASSYWSAHRGARDAPGYFKQY